MEKRGIATEKGNLNRWIKTTNKMISAVEKKVNALEKWVSENRQSSLIQSLNVYNSMRNASAYSQTVKVKNLKELTDDVNFLKANGIETFEDLQTAIALAKADERDCREALKAVETELDDKKELQRRVLAYANTMTIRNEYRVLKSDKAKAKFRKQHESEFIIMDSAKRYFAEHGITKIPSYKTLQSEIERLTSQQNELYEELHEKRDEVKRLQTVADNIQKTIGQENKRRNEYEI